MPSDTASTFDFVAQPQGFLDAVRIRLGLWLLRQSAERAARSQRQLIESLDASMRADIGAGDPVPEGGVTGLVKLHPHVLAFGGLGDHRRR